MPSFPHILDYRRPADPPTATLLSALVPFFVAYAAGGKAVLAVAVLQLDQWNGYVGREPSVVFGAIGGAVSAAGATAIAAIIAVVLQRITGRAMKRRSLLVLLMAGSLCGIATWLPEVLDERFTGVQNPMSDEVWTSGWGAIIGWICFLLGPSAVALSLVTWREGEGKESPRRHGEH